MTARALLGIVTCNRAQILTRAVASALLQQNCEVRISVIDNASSDDTPRLASRFPTVDWVQWPCNRGCMIARNHWMAYASEDYFVSLDDDAWFIAGDEIALAIGFLDENPTVAAVAFDVLSPDRPKRIPRGEAQLAALFIGCGHVLRLSAARSVGLYEVTPGSYGGEEKDLCLRLMDAGHKIMRLPGVHVWHDKTPLARAIPEQHRSGVCNDFVMTLRRTPAPLLLVALFVKVYKHLKFSCTNGLTNACLQGVGLFLRSIPLVWRSRRAVKTSTLRAFIRLSQG
jgi:GT2 family glycosyltransferase